MPDAGAARNLKPGNCGGRIGGGKGVRSGSMFGCLGASRLKGLMMMGGMVGGADGGPFGPPPARLAWCGEFIMVLRGCMRPSYIKSRLSV